ncbi:hypothetical protein FTUN_3304 [Frigoriglobus tundricola]|uniref:Uncharacterized protein n=1 Tax=Frigoriglobus tundricola TaxID=2774151 RepID=A0A6M5YQQ6_9BACT|nr:hypothetical protein FTUN_3304 [Frigoriglobus tundricola]
MMSAGGVVLFRAAWRVCEAKGVRPCRRHVSTALKVQPTNRLLWPESIP